MYYVGIDIAKYKHDCYICTSEGVTVLESFSFDNSNTGFKELQSALDHLDHSQQIKIGLEATGIYGKNLKLFLSSIGYDFHEFNPLLVKRFHDSLSNRKTKTDKIDARIIALYLSTGASRTYLYSSYHIEALKQLSRARNKLIRSRSDQYVIITNILDVEFPEFKAFFHNKLSDTALFLLNKYKTVDRMKRLTHQDCVLLHNKSRRIPTSSFEELRDLAKHTIGHHFNYNDLILSSALQIVNTLERQIESIEKEILAIMEELHSPIDTIPGISTLSAATILGEFGDFSKFSNPKQLCAFCGVEPAIYQSGTSFHNGRMVKHGSSELRYVLFNAVPYLVIHNITFREFFYKKLHEGKNYRVAQSHVVKKLLRVIYHLELTGESFDPTFLY